MESGMTTPKDRLELPYKATHAETADEMSRVTAGLIHADAPLYALNFVRATVEQGARKHAKGDWRTKSNRWFLDKALRHLRQATGMDEFWEALDDVSSQDWPEDPEFIDEESGLPHLAKAATNLLMALENAHNQNGMPAEVVPITAEELGLVYLAHPYTIDPVASARIAAEVSALSVANGIKVYSPVAYGHLVAPDASYDYWLAHGLDMLKRCDSLVMVIATELGPWTMSQGCRTEWELAAELGINRYAYYYDTKELVRA